MDFADATTDYRAYLIDMKGDGDRRHLVVCNYEGATVPLNIKRF